MADVKAWLGDKWARLRAYIHSIPPDVWIGLGIGAAALLLAWLAFRNKGTSGTSSGTSDGLSTSSPIIPATAADPLSNPASDNNILQWIDPAGNLRQADTAKNPVQSFADKYLADMHARNVIQSNDIHAASLLQTQNILASQHAGAITHSADIHAASLANTAKAAAAKVLAATTTRDESATARIISHPLAVATPKPALNSGRYNKQLLIS